MEEEKEDRLVGAVNLNKRSFLRITNTQPPTLVPKFNILYSYFKRINHLPYITNSTNNIYRYYILSNVQVANIVKIYNSQFSASTNITLPNPIPANFNIRAHINNSNIFEACIRNHTQSLAIPKRFTVPIYKPKQTDNSERFTLFIFKQPKIDNKVNKNIIDVCFSFIPTEIDIISIIEILEACRINPNDEYFVNKLKKIKKIKRNDIKEKIDYLEKFFIKKIKIDKE